MYRGMKNALFGGLLAAAMGSNAAMPGGMEQVPMKRIDLAEWLVAGKLKPVNREVAKLRGSQNAVHVDEKNGPGVVWIGETDFTEGTLEADVRGRDVFQNSLVGIAFHGNTRYSIWLLRSMTGRAFGKSFPTSSRSRWIRR